MKRAAFGPRSYDEIGSEIYGTIPEARHQRHGEDADIHNHLKVALMFKSSSQESELRFSTYGGPPARRGGQVLRF